MFGAPSPSNSRGSVFTRAGESLRESRDFRYLWLSNVLFIGGNWGQILVLSWMVFDITKSELLLAIFTAVRLMSLFLGPIAGVLADRYDRALIIRIASIWACAVMGILAILSSLDAVPYWLLVVAGLVAGLAGSPSQPARASLMLQLVGRSRLANANALNAMGFGITGAVAPAIGGLILARYGATVGLAYTGLWYLAAAVMIWQVRVTKRSVRIEHEPTLGMIREGLRVVFQSRAAVTVLVITLFSNILIWPISNSFLPVFASDVLSLGADGLGMLMMFSGVGSFFGSFVIASLGDFRNKGAIFVFGCMAWGAAWAAFGLSGHATLSYVLMLIIGLSGATFAVLQSTLMLITSPPEVQGRALGILELAIGSMPFGTLLLGTIAASIGVGRTTFAAGAVFVVLVAAHNIMMRDLVHFREEDSAVVGL